MPIPSRPPTYQGRALTRPAEELADQGLGFDVVTLLTRRRALQTLGLSAAALGLAGCAAGATSSSSAKDSAGSGGTTSAGEIPDETAGPYPGDGSNGPDVLEQSGIVRQDIRSSIGGSVGTAEGVAMDLELTLTDLAAGGPYTGAAVYVWHCTREGAYSLYSDGITDQNYLRGVQIADGEGRVRFTSIFPGCYDGRWPHVHLEVYPDQQSITDDALVVATSQVALPQEICEQVYAQSGYGVSLTNLAQVSLAGDNVFGDDGGASQLGVVTGDLNRGYTVALPVGVDTRTTPTGGQLRGRGAPAGGPGDGQR